jgi:hypothetical protein
MVSMRPIKILDDFLTHIAHIELPPLTGSTSPRRSGFPWDSCVVPAVEVTGGSILVAHRCKGAFAHRHRTHD